MHRNLKYLLITLLVVLIFTGYELIKYSGIEAYKTVKNKPISLENTDDGLYKGSFTTLNFFLFAEVEFQVNQGKIKKITIPYLIATPFKGVKKSITDSIKQSESIHFDAVSGATRSSFFVKAAMYKALSPESKKENN